MPQPLVVLRRWLSNVFFSWRAAGVGGKNLDEAQRAAATERVVKRAERVDRVVPPQDVLLMKVDVGE